MTPPNNNQLEVSLFGPGVGECVLVHLGDGDWLVVDSCLDRESKVPVALSYLRRLGLDPAVAIRSIVLTHWHDDHTGGAAQLLDAAPNADVVLSVALRASEFTRAVGASTAAPLNRTGLDTMCEVWERMLRRSEAGGASFVWALTGRRLLDSQTAQVWALSPSDTTVTRAFDELATLMPAKNRPPRRVIRHSANDVSIVLRVEALGKTVLLGGDLETTKRPNAGWDAIVTASPPSSALSSVFKVAHHGADNADHPQIWTTLLAPERTAILTRYNRGRRPRPDQDDVARIRKHATNAYVTSPPRRRKKDLSAEVGKLLRAQGATISEVASKMGHIRLRDESAGVHVELFGAAQVL